MAERIPARHSRVKHRTLDRFGTVLGHETTLAGTLIHVRWENPVGESRTDLRELRCGFRLAMEVIDVPRSPVRPSLGPGIVIDIRILGEREQVLVEFPESGQRIWMPYEQLRRVRGAHQSFVIPKAPGNGWSAESVRMRCLAYALELWNENTGALSHLDIDPLPHQIHLVHHILASGNLNWMIADDVGLGKTIEVGMLLAALQQRGTFRRILLVTPAGLTTQWQEELHTKFRLDDFQVYGQDFKINVPEHWKLHEHVIGSLDTLKADPHLPSLLEAPPWDLIVFDEAHRLGRRQRGQTLDPNDRYRLAEALRKRTDALMLLTATPHQGMADKFTALLELLRPEWKRRIDMLALQPAFLKDMVIRNNKAEVTDANGQFIFQGKDAYAIEVETNDDGRAFERALKDYLRRGYAAAQLLGQQGNAIGFVMTAYRKLAASSAAAIHAALLRRLERVTQARDALPTAGADDAGDDERFAGEADERSNGARQEFFAGEVAALRGLLEQSERLLQDDLKVCRFTAGLIEGILRHSPDEKVLVFTEYRATQQHLAGALGARFGNARVNLIHGGQTFEERRKQIDHFEQEGQFLISTEAGGEGINLQRCCRVMVNFDLPWNPMRLVQRIGRLYRYGQQRRVIVFNVNAPQTIDADIIGVMYQRLDAVVQQMATLGGEFRPGLAEDILGQIAEALDVADLLEQAAGRGREQTERGVEEALTKAREAVEKQRELFAYASGYDPDEARFELPLDAKHTRAFVEGMCVRLGIEIVRRDANLVWDLRIPEALRDELPGGRLRWRIGFDRVWGADRRDIEIIDIQSPLTQLLLRRAKAAGVSGVAPEALAAPVSGLDGSAFMASVLRWQNDQGRRLRQEFNVVLVGPDGGTEVNSRAFANWLLEPARTGAALPDRTQTQVWFKAVASATDRRLAAVSNADLHPEGRQWVSGGWAA